MKFAKLLRLSKKFDMKKIKKVFFFLWFVCVVFSANAQRRVLSVNEQWEFKGSSIWEESVEEIVDLPHTWNTKDAAQGYTYFRGEGTYSKKYFIKQSLFGSRLFSKFE